jgi:hypothetical protein
MLATGARYWPFVALLAALALVAAGCGGSKPASVASLGTPPSAGDRSSTATTAGSGEEPTESQLNEALLKYSHCMRANGVPEFPDPSGGGFTIRAGTGVNPASPTFQAARAKCKKLLPNGGPPGAGTTTHPSGQALANMLKVAQCMRRHGITGFPDPTTTVPSLHGAGEITDMNGVIFAFPPSVDTQSPDFVRAAGACGFPLLNH